MKKSLFYLMGLCALAFVSCQKEELTGNDVEGAYVYTFVGTNNPETKATIGPKDENGWPVLWEQGDKLGVYKADGTFAGTAELASGAGQNVGEFTLATTEALADGEALTLVYPYVEGTVLADGKFTMPLNTKQTASVGSNALAYATAVKAAKTVFTLNHTNAYVRFVLNTEEYKDYTLQGVTLWCDGQQVSGTASVAVADGALTVTAAEDYVKSTLAEGVVMGTEQKEVWATALPVDLTGKKVYAIVHMTKGIETVTLPVEIAGGNLKKHAVNTIKLPKLAKALAPAWYEPVETRYIAINGDGWCYGPDNTVLVTAKGTANTVEMKARGNFMKVRKPAYVQLAYATDMSVDKTTGYVLFDGTDAHDGSAYIEHAIGDDYTVDVTVKTIYNSLPNSQISGMVIKDEDKNPIWGINIWACLNALTTVSYKNGDILKFNIGTGAEATRNDWKANGCYFQWGRPWAYTWTGKITGTDRKQVDANVPFDVAISNPYRFFFYNGEPYNWFWGDGNSKDRSGDLDDLWGNPDGENKSGVKSIYDPCPKGYRVISPAILQEVEDGLVDKVNKGTKLHYLLHEGATWPFAGAYFGSSVDNLGKSLAKTSDNLTYMCAYWSNSNSGSNGRLMQYQPSAAEDKQIMKSRARASATPIRCMVDTENR